MFVPLHNAIHDKDTGDLMFYKVETPHGTQIIVVRKRSDTRYVAASGGVRVNGSTEVQAYLRCFALLVIRHPALRDALVKEYKEGIISERVKN